MNFNYCVLSILLASSITHAMESENKPSQDSKSKTLEGRSLPLALQEKKNIGVHRHKSSKKNIPFSTPISFRRQISFNGQSKSIFEWLSRPYEPFGKTPILSVSLKNEITSEGHVNNILDPKSVINRISLQQALYIANTHSHRLTEKGKRIAYGTLVLSGAIGPKTTPESIVQLSDQVLGYILLEKMKSPKLSPRKKADSQSKGKEIEEKA